MVPGCQRRVEQVGEFTGFSGRLVPENRQVYMQLRVENCTLPWYIVDLLAGLVAKMPECQGEQEAWQS